MRDVLIGLVAGVAALLAVSVLRPVAAFAPAWSAPVDPAVRQVTADRAAVAEALGADDRSPATRMLDDAVRKKLATPIPAVTHAKAPLDEVLDSWAAAADVNLHVQWRALEAAGINEDAPITINLRGVPAEQVLRRVLEDVGGGNIKLEYRVDEGVVDVSTAEEMARYRVTRVYDVRDLLDASLAQDRELHGAAAEQTDQDVAVGLVTMIEQSMGPTWDGPQTIGYFAGRLIVNKPQAEQDRILKLLTAMRTPK